MNPFKSKPVHTLDDWLVITTGKLAVLAQKRIRQEITAHFNDAMEAHLANGALEPDARRAALAELGDAKIAAGRFRRKHLTCREADCLTCSLKQANDPKGVFLCWLLTMFTLLISLLTVDKSDTRLNQILVGGLIATLIVLPVASTAATRKRLNVPLLILFQISKPLTYFCLYYAITRMVPLQFFIPISFGMFFGLPKLVYQYYPNFSLWLKLWKYKGCREDFPNQTFIVS